MKYWVNIVGCLFFLLLPTFMVKADAPAPVITDKIKDKFVPAYYEAHKATLEGYIGQRMRINLEQRLLKINLPSLLEPYVHRPGKQTWIGEHVGKFLHAATYSWQYTGNAQLKEKMDSVVRVLISTQMPDGYLGTYLEKDRWTAWDVWSHKYNLIGLLTYYQATGNQPALVASRKMGNLLIKVFLDGKKDIIKSGTHVGMAPTSVLEPMVLLYRYTGDKRYLEFCQYLVKSWEQPHGPKILSSLLQHGNVHKTANGKAYEMLSNLVGLLDLYRVTGNEQYLQASTNAWQDIKIKRHYPTGTSSWGEHFQGDYELRPDGEVHGDKYESAGEGCVTVTWLQMNWHLLRFTGEPKYADELERITFNGLMGAQSPQDGTVCYFIPLTGRKRFAEVNHGIQPDVSCCASSIPRGVALIPQFVAGSLNQNQAVVWQYIPGNYPIQIKSAKGNLPVELRIATAYPKEGNATIAVHLPEKTKNKTKFAIQLRVPEWCSNYQAKIGDETFTGNAGQLLTLERAWQTDDQILVTMSMDLRTVADANKGSEGIIIERGPQVLAVDDMLDTVSELPKGWVGDQFYKIKGKVNGKETVWRMVPFAEAGQTKGHYQVIQPRVTDLSYAP